MTLILGIGCEDGAVLAADSAATDSDSGLKQPVEKIKRCGEQPVVYGGSGNLGLLQKIDEALATLRCKATISKTRQEIRRLVVPVTREDRASYISFPQPPFDKPPMSVLLFAGVLDGRPWILEIERDCQDTLYAEELGYFTAIGSGKPWAQAAFRAHLRSTRTLRAGKIMAYRVVEDAIDLAAAGLARPIRMWTVSVSGDVKEIKPRELQGIGHTCECWRQVERESLGSVLAQQGAAEPGQVPPPTSPNESSGE